LEVLVGNVPVGCEVRHSRPGPSGTLNPQHAEPLVDCIPLPLWCPNISPGGVSLVTVDYKLALVFFWAAFRVLFITAVVLVVVMLANIAVPAGLSGLLTIIGMCAVGSLITYSLEHYGIPKHKFPGVGANTIFVLFVLSWVAVGLWFLATKL
jgi:hypothetical protein